jgi:hypothetical protein
METDFQTLWPLGMMAMDRLIRRSDRNGENCTAADSSMFLAWPLSTFARTHYIPARYVNGFLGDIGVPPEPAPMDYNAWFEVFLDGRWFTFDARHNIPRIGRITVARPRCN